jgi:tRNA-specific adenosine deaminase 3
MDKKFKIEIIPGMGRGVVAEENIKKGELIARFELLVLSTEETSAIAMTKLAKYTYNFDGKNKQDCLALGAGALLNHSDHPNTFFEIVIKADRPMLQISALTEIKTGDQLVIDYGSDDPTFKSRKSFYFE